MQNAQLMSHVDTDLVTREQLALVETPDATRSFKPSLLSCNSGTRTLRMARLTPSDSE